MKSKVMHTFPRWQLIGMVAVLLILTFAGAWYYRSQERAVRQIAEAQLTSTGRLKADQVTAWREERLADAAVLTESPFFAQGVARFLADPSDAQVQPFLARFRPLKIHCHYSDILLVTPQGQTLLSLKKRSVLSEACKTALVTALRERRPILSELYTSAQHLIPHLGVVAPIFANAAPDALPLGAVVLVTDAARFLYPLIQSWPTPSQTAETLLVRREGKGVLILNNVRHQTNVALKLRLPLSRNDVPAVLAVLGRQGMFQGKDYRGVEVLAVILPVLNSPWFMVAKEDTMEVFAQWRFHALLILALFLSIVGGFGAIGLFAWQRRQKAHYQMLYLSEARQQESERKFRLLFENMTTGFALYETICDPDELPVDFRFLEINPAFEKLFGIRSQNCIGSTLTKVAPDTEQHWIETFGRVARSGEPVFYENYARQIGRYLNMWVFTPAQNLLATMVSDITEHKRAEEEVKQSQIKKIESLQRMAGGVAHHYNNMMSVVLGNIELALSELPGESRQAGDLKAAMTAAHRASELGTMMLTYLGQRFFIPLPLDLCETCRGLLPTLRAGIQENVTFQTDLPEPGPVIRADAGQVRLMLQNLVANAWEAIGQSSGTVSLKVRRASCPPAGSGTAFRRPVEFDPKPCGYASLEVKDTGCGIARNDFEELFDPFYSTKFTGRGLGLSLVMGAVKSHEGCILLESEPGRGSVFQIFLPLAAEADGPLP